jgi:hypothetical protein
MTDKAPVDIIKARQLRWANGVGRSLDDQGQCGSIDDSLFEPLSAAARTNFEKGGGDQLAREMKAVHSSSALACNWFDYWRERDFGVLSTAFNVPDAFVTLQLEVHVPTGMRGADANLDVLLTTATGSLFAIESRFGEPYAPSPAKSVLKPQYFAQGRSRWTDLGLPGCQAVAEELRAGQHDFAALDVVQLLKHMLALARTGNRWTLCCLWYEVPGAIAAAHRQDLTTFTARIGDDAKHFSALTYQELFARMERVAGAGHADYMNYLRDRYVKE